MSRTADQTSSAFAAVLISERIVAIGYFPSWWASSR
jgi:hypothetical protein